MSSVGSKSGEDSFVWRVETGIKQPSIEENDTEEELNQDFYFASSSSDSTFEDVTRSLEETDSSTERLRPSDIRKKDGDIFVDGVEASDFDGKIFYRPSTWFADLSNEEQLEKMNLMIDLENQYDVDFYGGAQSALISRDKKATKETYSSKGMGTVEDYSFDEARERLESGENLVAKPRKGTCQGDCVELVESESELEGYISRVLGKSSEDMIEENLLFEEYLPTGKNGENSDIRMIVVGDDVYRRERTDGDGIANNLDNNGEYVKAPEMSFEEERLADKTREIFGEGLYAVDYIRDEDGSVKVLENNATPGTKIDEDLDIDLMNKVADDLYSEGSPAAGNKFYEDPAVV